LPQFGWHAFATNPEVLARILDGGKTMFGNRRLLAPLAVWIAASGFGGFAMAERKPPANRPVAFVNGEPISRADYDAAASRVPELAATAADNPNRPALQKQLIGLLVDELLLRQFLRKQTPAPDPGAVAQRLRDLEQKLQAKGRTLADYCREAGESRAQVEASITAALQWHAYLAKQITEAELRRSYDANREVFDGVLLRASHIFLAVPSGASDAARQRAAERLRQIRREIEGGMPFDRAAKQFSQDPATLAQGGDLGYFPPYQADKNPLVRAALALEVGQLSDVIATESGCHLVLLTERKSGKPTRFESARPEVLTLLTDELRSKVIAEERSHAKIEILGP
jgi:parvulin-like peptidyl-prolyl isomerase